MKRYIDNIQKLNQTELTELIGKFTKEDQEYARKKAVEVTKKHFGSKIYIRGLIEFTNVCRNDCLYCGIRRSNKNVCRFRMNENQILSCCEKGYELGFRTFVLQGGEDGYFTDERLVPIIRHIRNAYPDCAITLSLGERSAQSYQRLYAAGADRYLLRHETADEVHYERLHPADMKYENRINCLNNLKKAGFQTGCGMMVGSPYQTPSCIAKDLIFMREFQPEMVGIGPFIPQKETPFRDQPKGSVELTLFLLSLIRLMLPDVLLPATTALGSAEEDGRIRGILSGANVYMPNLSPKDYRDKYLLYDGKNGLNDEAAYVLAQLKNELGPLGYEIAVDRGDYISGR